MGTIRGVRAQVGHREKKRFGKTSFDSDLKKAKEPMVTYSRCPENDILTVRGPFDHKIRAWMISESFWCSAFKRNDVNIDISIILSRKSYPLLIGRYFGESFRADMRGKPAGITTFPLDNPEVSSVGENDAFAAHIRLAEKLTIVNGVN